MTPLSLLLVLLVECCSVAGQVCFKKAMVPNDGRSLFARFITIGISLKAVEFFLWTGLLAKFSLSYLYPFDAFNRIALVIAAWIFLKERATPRLWVGVGLITAGVSLVSTT